MCQQTNELLPYGQTLYCALFHLGRLDGLLILDDLAALKFTGLTGDKSCFVGAPTLLADKANAIASRIGEEVPSNRRPIVISKLFVVALKRFRLATPEDVLAAYGDMVAEVGDVIKIPGRRKSLIAARLKRHLPQENRHDWPHLSLTYHVSYRNLSQCAGRGGQGCLQENMMALAHGRDDNEPPYLPLVKQLSGQRVEAERRRLGTSQVALGRRVGLGPTWIRHLEGGYAKVRLEDHLACLDILGVSPLALLLPILFAARNRQFPQHLLMGDLESLEPILIEAIIDWNVAGLRAMLERQIQDEGVR